ncbi:MAG: threonine synthase [candidate division KSB1 bacterium]|nr:threonine synthase [candidate division KSB1 bacterium]
MDGLVCQACGATYSLDEPRWRCKCGGVLDVEFAPAFDLARIRQRPPTLWRYREALPIRDDANRVSFCEGLTPLIETEIGGRSVFVKQEHLFPTGSFKDRGASVLVSKIRELGIRRVVEDSSGNAGCAVAAYCARADIECEIFVPADTAEAKLTQIRLYGARLRRIPGTREDTARAAWDAAQHKYYASHVWNPFFLQGTKTFAYEVCEQMGWQAPDTVVLPVGHGTLLLGAYIGFRDLQGAGIIGRLPKLIGVQAMASAPVYEAFLRGMEQPLTIAKRPTIAEGIAIAEPVRGKQVLRVVRETNGRILAVEETEIADALLAMCRKGFYIEPTSAAAIAGVRRYIQQAQPDEVIVSALTGHGLKATEKMAKIAAG